MTNLLVTGGGNFLLPVGTVLVFAVIGLVMFLWLWALIDAVRISDQVWGAADQSKILWVILIVLLGLLGSLLYVVIPGPALRRAGA
jgi:hypothetical protein